MVNKKGETEMLEIKTFVCNMIQENCFVVSDSTGEAVIIDCGAFYDTEKQAIVDYIRSKKLKVKHLLCTHAHFDHVFGNEMIAEEFGVLPEIHQAELPILRAVSLQVEDMLGMNCDLEMPEIGHFLTDSEVVTFGNHNLKVLHTPGHSPGGVVFYCEEESVLFSGDTLFRMSVGRTDLQMGSWEQLIQSLNTVLAALPDNTVVYCGHGPATTIGEEKRMNPFLR